MQCIQWTRFFCVFWTGYTQGSLCCVIMCCALCVECNVAERFGQICFLVEFGAVDSLNSSNPVAKASLFLPVFCRLFKHAWIQPWKPTRDRLPNTCKTWGIYDWTQKKQTIQTPSTSGGMTGRLGIGIIWKNTEFHLASGNWTIDKLPFFCIPIFEAIKLAPWEFFRVFGFRRGWFFRRVRLRGCWSRSVVRYTYGSCTGDTASKWLDLSMVMFVFWDVKGKPPSKKKWPEHIGEMIYECCLSLTDV